MFEFTYIHQNKSSKEFQINTFLFGLTIFLTWSPITEIIVTSTLGC